MVVRHTVRLPNLYRWEPREWAATHCPSYLSCTMHGSFSDPKYTQIDYHFEDEKDVVVFTLKWM